MGRKAKPIGLHIVEGNGSRLTKKKQLHEQMKSLAVEFGLTPSSRARLAMPQKKKWKGLKKQAVEFSRQPEWMMLLTRYYEFISWQRFIC
ncbi:Phage terminase, small subunit [Marininema mesophilum]|uniref:Phage terminase, small subunit n=1 Tax=Marininema mesophilum TaxID=1048340 RepID=A0A1H3C5P6_9BACL|nr:Phage terminase, small subunit [Marininema mesophilum]